MGLKWGIICIKTVFFPIHAIRPTDDGSAPGSGYPAVQ
jgi:hypothetical protein